MRILGLDVGEKRIGVAKADSTTRIAVPVGFVEVNGSEWQEIGRIARLQGTVYFVIGLPRSNEGKETQQSLYARGFAKELIRRIPEAKVRMQDESLTSVLAEERLKASGRAYEKGDIDAEAAAIILQDFLEGLKSPEVLPSGAVENDISGASDELSDSNSLGPTSEGPTQEGYGKKKSKKGVKIAIGLGILAVVGLIATGVGLLMQREQRKQEYAAWVAEQEAKLAETFTFTVRPGETIRDVRESLIQTGYSGTEVDEALAADYDFGFLRKRPAGASLEGYLFGETYEFYEGTPATEVIRKFLEGMNTVITENNLEARFAEYGLSLHEGIILASVVQKEASDSDMPTVAQVFLSRLDYGIALGSDVTVSYALDVVDPNREVHGDNETALGVDSCYNTRKYAGLPCGAISNPGLSALLAVANPTDTSYLYFLTGDDGMMYYSYTEAEHLQNAAEHCQTLCNISL